TDGARLRAETIAAHQEIRPEARTVREARFDAASALLDGRCALFDADQRVPEVNRDLATLELFRERRVQSGAPDHRERPAEGALVRAAIDASDRSAGGVRERERPTGMPSPSNGSCNTERVEHPHAVRRHPEERALREGQGRASLRHDDLE